MSGCFIVDDLLAPPPKEKEKTLQERSETAIKLYVRNNAKSDKYDPYGFGELKIVKPLEIQELEELEEEQTQNNSDHQARKIDSLKKHIRENRIERTVELEHFFTLKDSVNPKKIQVLESTFILDDTLGVKNFKPQLILELDPKLEDVLVYYFFEYTIFLAETYQSSKELSIEFYNFFKSGLENIKSIERKSEFLAHVLDLCDYVKKNGSFDPDIILQDKVSDHISTKRNDISEYSSINFSSLFVKTAEEDENRFDPEGYYFFHKFIGSYKNEIDTNVVMVEFSKYYEIDNIYQMDRPFERYFKP